MDIQLTSDEGMPIYRQIVNQVKHMLGAGRLQPGVELPSVRTLAQQLLVNPNTIARAYHDLETMGLVISKQGAGTFVTDSGSPLARRERLRMVRERVEALLVEARQLGFSPEQVKDLLDKSIAAVEARDMKTA